jgi:hypothetical protein
VIYVAKGTPSYTRETFIRLFNSIACREHRYTVFRDFVQMSATALHIPFCKNEALEKEYLALMEKYSKEEIFKFEKLLDNLIEILQPEPRDILGSLCAELELGNLKNGQFFTPHELSVLMAKMLYSGVIDELKTGNKPFVTVLEPACGAGGMVLAFAGEMRQSGLNPAEKLFVRCIDIDRLMGFMCYLQLSLWGIPAQIIIGNTLSGEWREIYYTPIYYLHGWDMRLKIRKFMDLCESPKNPQPDAEPPEDDAGLIGVW